ncbi:MAG: 16S rRNA (adenine(1518)-N(6)/adenine(1519)-N(6))-dimethyltransferase [Deltaproteobacteria bacterium]|nr:16S rRNA (adenine(1518)-N(6)/adenine(1519)-N(6))-dimethyltransferase [Deltaproteobacteria bacterium]
MATPRAKKKFGQHFLNDRNIIKKIVEAAGVKQGDLVLEIGPGTGMLTRELLDTGARVVAVEVDRDLIALLANLPYYISGPLLSKLLTERAAFSIMVLMFQKEVAVRIAAGPGNRDYGNLSVLSQAFTDVKREFDVPAHLFSPKPKVDSSVVSFRVLEEPKIKMDDESYFRTVVRAAFGTRRKTLSNSLSALGLAKADTLAALQEAGVDPVRRGETLDLNEFARLAHALYLKAHPMKNPGTLP